MSLLPNGIRLSQPSFEFGIDFGSGCESKMMDMIPRRNRLNFSKTRLFKSSGQNDMAIDPFRTGRQLRKRHPHLKRYPRLLGQYLHLSASPNCFQHRLVNFTDFRRLAFEVRLQIMPAAKVRLITIRELPFAPGAFPQGPFGTPFHSILRSLCFLVLNF
jgi:hypothetical protein